MSDPILAPDFQPDGQPDGAPAPKPAPAAPEQAMAALQAQIDTYIASLQVQVKKDLDAIMAKAGFGAGASPATPFRPGG